MASSDRWDASRTQDIIAQPVVIKAARSGGSSVRTHARGWTGFLDPARDGGEGCSRRLGFETMDFAAVGASHVGHPARAAVCVQGTHADRDVRSVPVRVYVLRRMKGRCETCHQPASFPTRKGMTYLEPHRTVISPRRTTPTVPLKPASRR